MKNESAVIERCLNSLKSFIHHWVIVDTGSTDGTQDIIRRTLSSIPGELYERPWVNFGFNRTEALLLSKGKGDYVFVIDADEYLELPSNFNANLTADRYTLLVNFDGVSYHRACLLKNTIFWEYVGVLHEYVDAKIPFTETFLPGPTIIVKTDGFRSTSMSQQEKFAKDAEVLEQALVLEPNNSRYMFYLAQSYRDSYQFEKAREMYLKRVALGGWQEEVWFSMFQAAIIADYLGMPEAVVLNELLLAYNFRPWRAETLVELARICRNKSLYSLAFLFSKQAHIMKKPDDKLFVDDACYEWRALDEYALACYWTGNFQVSIAMCDKLLVRDLPESERIRIKNNRQFALAAINNTNSTQDKS
ncbi:MAG: glycosyltransferase family 2 protein [Candidatus Nitrosotenuis sp.]